MFLEEVIANVLCSRARIAHEQNLRRYDQLRGRLAEVREHVEAGLDSDPLAVFMRTNTIHDEDWGLTVHDR
jgi:hypothetical protein